MTKRISRLNSLLKRVISEVVHREVRDPRLHLMPIITRVDMTQDLKYAKVYVSIIGTEQERTQAIEALEAAAGFIAASASKKMVIRFFPHLTFYLDTSVDQQAHIDHLLQKVQKERESRNSSLPHDN
jgi:ribosome-binding factor A